MRTRNSELQLSESTRSQTTIASNLFLVIGVCIILTALVYMIVNLHKADSILTMWLTFMIIGVSFSFCGLIIRLIAKSSERKIRNFTRGRATVHY